MINEKLALIMERLKDRKEDVQANALNMLYDEVRSTAGTITTEQQDLFDIVAELKNLHKKIGGRNQAVLGDLISVLSVGQTTESLRDTLLYRIGGNGTNLEEWAHQYVKTLVEACIKVRRREIEAINYLPIVEEIVCFFFKHNSEIEAIDYLLEISSIEPLDNFWEVENNEKGTDINRLELIPRLTDANNFDRVYTYLLEMARFYNLREIILELVKNKPTLKLVHMIEFGMVVEAIEYVKAIRIPTLKKQALYILARFNICYPTENKEEQAILENEHVSKFFLSTAEDLEIMPAKKIEHILKGLNSEKVDAAAVCNGLIHFGYMRDTLFKRFPEDYNIKTEYITMLNHCNNKALTISASIGCVHGFNHKELIESYPKNIFEIQDPGTLLGVAIAGSRSHDMDQSILQLLSILLTHEDPKHVLSALLGISSIYSGSICDNKEAVYEKVFPLVNHTNPDIICMAIYTICSTFYGSARQDLIAICNDILTQPELEQSEFHVFAILGVGLLFYKRTDLYKSEEFNSLVKPVKIIASGLMFIGSGLPDKIVEIMTACFAATTEPLNESLGLIASALVGVGDPLAAAMVENQMKDALLLNNAHIKNVVPLCLSLLYASTNKTSVVEYLERAISSRDSSIPGVVALGIVGAGTNNAKIVKIMSSQFNSMYKDTKTSNALIYAQGLVSLGKGLLTLSPLVCNERVIVDKSIIGLLFTSFMMLHDSYSCFTEHSYMLYGVTQAIMTKHVTGITGEIKVGKPVETVGLSGKPSKISGRIVHTAPVVLNPGQMAETDVPVETEFIEDVLVAKE